MTLSQTATDPKMLQPVRLKVAPTLSQHVKLGQEFNLARVTAHPSKSGRSQGPRRSPNHAPSLHPPVGGLATPSSTRLLQVSAWMVLEGAAVPGAPDPVLPAAVPAAVLGHSRMPAPTPVPPAELSPPAPDGITAPGAAEMVGPMLTAVESRRSAGSSCCCCSCCSCRCCGPRGRGTVKSPPSAAAAAVVGAAGGCMLSWGTAAAALARGAAAPAASAPPPAAASAGTCSPSISAGPRAAIDDRRGSAPLDVVAAGAAAAKGPAAAATTAALAASTAALC